MALAMPTMQMQQINDTVQGKRTITAVQELLSVSSAYGESPKVDFQKLLNAPSKEQVQKKVHIQQKENSQKKDPSEFEAEKKTENTLNVKQRDDSLVLDDSDQIFDQQESNEEQSVNFLMPMFDQESFIKPQISEGVESVESQQKDVLTKSTATLNDEAIMTSEEEGSAVKVIQVSMSSSQEIEVNNNVMFTKDWLALREEKKGDEAALQFKQKIIPQEIMTQEESFVEILDTKANLHHKIGSENQNFEEEMSDKENSKFLDQDLDETQKQGEGKKEILNKTTASTERKTDHMSSMQDFVIDSESFIGDDRGFSKGSIAENIQGNIPTLMQKSSTAPHNFTSPDLPIVRQVSQALHAARQKGIDSLTLELKPEHLGRVEIKLEITDGQVRAIFNIDKAEMYDLLRRDESVLQSLLNESGLKADDGALNFNFQGEQQSFDDESSSLTTIIPALSVDGEAIEVVIPSVVIDHNRALDRLV